MKLISSSQCRAARGLLNWSQIELARRCDMHKQTVSNFEAEKSTLSQLSLEKITLMFERNGVIFTEQGGVNPNISSVITYRGQAGFIEFLELVYQTARDQGGDICVSNVDEALFTKHLEEETDKFYMERMKQIKTNFTFKIIIKEGDTNIVASDYAEYRWIPTEQFHGVPFYVFGDNLAFLIFDDQTTIHLIYHPEIASAQRTQFTMAWENAQPVSEREIAA